MYKVVLHGIDGITQEYTTPTLQYAKRYADLYKDGCPFVEIIRTDIGGETVIETFGHCTGALYKP